MHSFINIYQDFSTIQLVKIIDNSHLYEPEALEAVNELLKVKGITEADLEEARTEIIRIQQEKDQAIGRRIIIYLKAEFRGLKSIIDRLKHLDIKIVFWIFFGLSSVLIGYMAVHEIKYLLWKSEFGYDGGFMFNKNPWSSPFIYIIKIGFMPLAAVLLALKKKIGWSFILIGMTYFIPHMIFEYLNFMSSPIVKIFRIFWPRYFMFDYVFFPLVMTFNVYKLSTKKMRNYLGITKREWMTTLLISLIAITSPWYRYIFIALEEIF